MPWQTCRGSVLLGFVGADAATLAARMAADALRRWERDEPRCSDPATPAFSPA